MKKITKKLNKFFILVICAGILFQSSMISVYAQSNLTNEEILDSLEELEPELKDIVDAAIKDIYSELLNADENTQILVSDVMSQLELLNSEMEEKLETTEYTAVELMDIMSSYQTQIEEVIAPYILEESETYVGEVYALLLSELESSLNEYVEELEVSFYEKLENVVTDSIIDIIKNIVGTDDVTVDELEEFTDALDYLINNNLEEKYENYQDAATALEEYTTSDNLNDEIQDALNDALETANYNTLKEKISETAINAVFLGYTDYYNMDEIYELVWNNELTYDKLVEMYTGTWSDGIKIGVITLPGTADYLESQVSGISSLISAVSLYSNLTEDQEDEITDEYLESDDTFLSLSENLATAYSELTSEIETFTESLTIVSEFLNLELDTSDLYDLLISGDINATDLVSNLVSQNNNISFIIDASSVVTDLVASLNSEEDINYEETMEYLETLVNLAEEYNIDETIENIINDILVNVEEEFNEEYLFDVLEGFVDAISSGVENFADKIGTDGYPQLPSEMIEEMYNEVVTSLEEVLTESQIEELLASLIETDVIEEIIADIYEILNDYNADMSLTYDEVVDIIVDNVINKVIELINNFLAEDDVITSEIIDNKEITTIPSNVVDDALLEDNGLDILNSNININIDTDILNQIKDLIGDESFKLVIEDITGIYNLSDELNSIIIDEKIYKIYLTDMEDNIIIVDQGNYTISVPYELSDGMFSDNILLTDIVNGQLIDFTYESNLITFVTQSLSTYVVGYNYVDSDLPGTDSDLSDDVVTDLEEDLFGTGSDSSDDVVTDLEDDSTDYNEEDLNDEVDADTDSSTLLENLTEVQNNETIDSDSYVNEDNESEENNSEESDEDNSEESDEDTVIITSDEKNDSSDTIKYVLYVIGILLILIVIKKIVDSKE